MRLGKHVDGPAADNAVGRAGDYVVCVLGADDVEAIDRVCVSTCRAATSEGCFLYWEWGAGASVPKQNLATICAAED